MDSLVERLIAGKSEEFSRDLTLFVQEYGNAMKFEELEKNSLRAKLWTSLFEHLKNDATSVHAQCLATLRILSRDKNNLDNLIKDDQIDIVLQNAGLSKICDDWQLSYNEITIESLKLLCNLLFNSIKVQKSASTTSCLPWLIERINAYDKSVPYQGKLFDLRFLFLLTALNVPTRSRVRSELSGDLCLIKMLKQLLEKYIDETATAMNEEESVLVCEILKILFNLYVHSDNENKDEEGKFEDLAKLLHALLVNVNSSKPTEVQSNIVNLLTVIPCSCYSLVTPAKSDKSKVVYQNRDMTAIFMILQFLDNRLDSNADLVENLSPVVSALVRLVKSDRYIRKYLRQEVLPPLKDVMNRPEEGNTVRAKLCKLLTSPLTELRDLVAEFLFILCKERVGRMVKYTGYGNAAGMFAQKGLLGRNVENTNYSSESEDSDTEEYLKYKAQINPVTGCYEEAKPNPLEGMSEEQKEYEAMKLVRLVDALSRKNIVVPCRIGDDGKPKPIDHVLELQEQLPKQQFTRRNSNDSDDEHPPFTYSSYVK